MFYVVSRKWLVSFQWRHLHEFYVTAPFNPYKNGSYKLVKFQFSFAACCIFKQFVGRGKNDLRFTGFAS